MKCTLYSNFPFRQKLKLVKGLVQQYNFHIGMEYLRSWKKRSFYSFSFIAGKYLATTFLCIFQNSFSPSESRKQVGIILLCLLLVKTKYECLQ